MESIETKVKRLDIIVEHLEDRVDDIDLRTSNKFKRIMPVIVHAAKNNLIQWFTLIMAVVSILMQIVNR